VPLDVKICGITTHDAMAAARDNGAGFVGLVFYPRSPRYVAPRDAGALAAAKGDSKAVAVTVDLPDMQLAAILDSVAIDVLQLHGDESPARVAEIRRRFGVPVMKAVAIAGPDDVARAHAHAEVADRLLFDAKPAEGDPRELPGGNARAFDWRLLAGETWPVPWLLSGGLTAETVGEAVRVAGAPGVDVSSGVESAPGAKDPARIAAFLAACRAAG
jgi:phosphoribosylanthranilate isomerase